MYVNRSKRNKMLSIKYVFNLYCIPKNKKFCLYMHIDCKNK